MADPAPQSSTSGSTAPPPGENDATRSPTPPGGFHAYKPVLSSDDFLSSTETNLARPLTDATITIRVIKSFPYRSVKNLVLNHIDLTKMTVLELEERCRKGEPNFSPLIPALPPPKLTPLSLSLHRRIHPSSIQSFPYSRPQA